MRKGLFLSRNHGRISATVDLEGLARNYSDLAFVRVYDHLFGHTEQQDILNQVDRHKLDGVVLAGHSAVHFEHGMQGQSLVEALKSHGINRNKIALANLDEQVAMVHTGAFATRKAGLLIDTALARLDYCHDIETVVVSPRHSVLVIGTTAAGIVAAAALLAKDYKVYLLEKGAAFRSGKDDDEKRKSMLTRIKSHPSVEIFLNCDLEGIYGWCGDYSVEIGKPSGSVSITVGAVLLCVGDDTVWISGLRSKMHLMTDTDGFLASDPYAGFAGRTKDPGIWFVPCPAGSDPLASSEEADANAAVLGLTAILDQVKIEHPVLVSEVEASLCGGCGTCVKTCAFAASRIDGQSSVSIIDARRCMGCGNCVTACPTGARDLIACPTRFVNSAIDILSKADADNYEPKVLAFLCKNSGYPAADAAAEPDNRICTADDSPNVLPLRIECAGNIDTLYVLNAFQKGFEGVALVVCKDGHCHNVVGNTDMERRLGLLRAVLRSRRIDDNRMRIIHTAGSEGKGLNEALKAFSEELREINHP